MNLKSLLAATALCSVMIAPAYAQTAPKMRDVLKTWQLDKPNASSQFVTKSVTEDRAVLENVVFKDPTTNKTDVTFGQLVLQRMPSTGANASQSLFNVTLENGVSLAEKDERTTIGKIEITGLSPTSNLSTLVNWLNDRSGKSGSGPAITGAAFEGDVRVLNVATQSKDVDGKPTQNKVGTINLLGIALTSDGFSTRSMEMLNLEFTDEESAIRMGNITLANFKSEGWQVLRDSANLKGEDFNFKGLSLGSMLIKDVTMDMKLKGEKEEADTFNFAMDQIELSDLTDKKIGKFGMSGMKATTGEAEKRFDMSLESFAMQDINVGYFAAIGEALTKLKPSLETKPTGRSALLGFAELASETVVMAATAAPVPKPASPPAVPATSPKLKDLLPGGPLDTGFGTISMSKFGIEVQGFNFTIDRIATSLTRNADGIITESRMAPTTMKLTVPEALLNQPDSPVAMFAPLLADGIELVIQYEATYDPATDIAKVNELGYEFKGWAGVNLTMAMDGLAKFYREQTIDSLVGPLAADLNKSDAPKGKGGKKPDDLEQLKQTLAIYQGVRFLNGALELRDQGGIAKAAGVFASMMAPPAKGATSRSAAQDAQAMAQVRQSWAQPLRDQAAQKNKSVFERQFLISLARWVEVGGVMTAVMQPPAPVDIPSVTDPKDLPTRLGLTFTNQPAAKN